MLKLATTEQIDFYETILYPMQDEIFTLLQSDKFYLTGGTCLSRFYFHHRYSDDLDFFFLGHIHSKEDFEIEFTIILQRIRKRFKTEISINGEYFKRVMVFESDHELKLEFIYDTTPVVGERVSFEKIFLDTKDNIVANKITAVQGRKTYKDYFDLFFLLKEFDILEVIKWTELKMVPLNYEGMLLVLVDGDLRGDVFILKEIDSSEFDNFINSLTGTLLEYAKTIP